MLLSATERLDSGVWYFARRSEIADHEGGTADMTRSVARFAILLGTLVLALGGCFGAYQVSPDSVQAVGSLTPNVEDRDAGLVAIAPGFDIKAYKIIAVDKFPVTDPSIKDEGDRRKAAEMSTILQNELVRRL